MNEPMNPFEFLGIMTLALTMIIVAVYLYQAVAIGIYSLIVYVFSELGKRPFLLLGLIAVAVVYLIYINC